MIIELVNAPRGSKVIFLAGSGTAGMEASLIKFLGKEDKDYYINE
jgi:aspartate aminotransferase-like enzyme